MTFREEIQKAVEAKKRKDSECIDKELRELTEKVERDWKVLFGEELAADVHAVEAAFYRGRMMPVFSVEGIEFCVETWGERYFPDYKLVKSCPTCGTEYHTDLFFDRGTPDEPGKYREANLATMGAALEEKHSDYLCENVLDNKAGITTERRFLEAIREFIREFIREIPQEE